MVQSENSHACTTFFANRKLCENFSWIEDHLKMCAWWTVEQNQKDVKNLIYSKTLDVGDFVATRSTEKPPYMKRIDCTVLHDASDWPSWFHQHYSCQPVTLLSYQLHLTTSSNRYVVGQLLLALHAHTSSPCMLPLLRNPRLNCKVNVSSAFWKQSSH